MRSYPLLVHTVCSLHTLSTDQSSDRFSDVGQLYNVYKVYSTVT